ncbi:MAG: TonB family protein [Cyclobacteriaceae bacterium]
MSIYLIELSVIHLALMGAYWLFLKNETQYGKMRFYILSATLLSLIIPVFKLPKLFFQGEEAVSSVVMPLQPFVLGETVMNSTADTALGLETLLWITGLISFYFLVRFLNNVIHLIRLERGSSYEFFHQTKIRRIKGIKGSFTFFHWIFLADDISKDQAEYDAILRHEKAHATLGHTYDLLFLELFKAIFWWLPTAWFAKREIKKIHEYQADAYAVKACTIDRYSSILISSTLQANGLSLASSFHDGLIFKRLNAMKQKAKNVSPWKIGTVTLLAATLFVVFACSEEMEQNIQKMGEASNSISFDQLPADMRTSLEKLKDDLTFVKVTVDNLWDENTKFSVLDQLEGYDPEIIHQVYVEKGTEQGAIYIALRKDGANFDYLAQKSKSDDDVFMIVEQQPEYPAGKDALYSYIAGEIKYPEAARKQGIEGPVYVEFVVGIDGAISDVRAVKGIGAGCDEEAVRVIKGVSNFIPGKQRGKKVAVKMVIPIHFALTEGVKKVGMEIKSDFNSMDITAVKDNGVWKGKVINQATGKAMPGVNVVEEGTNFGTVTDLDGTFEIALSDQTNDLVLSHVGFKTSRLEAAK